MKKNKLSKFLIIFCVIFFSFAGSLFAADGYVPLAPINQLTVNPNCDTSNPNYTGDAGCRINVIDYIPKAFSLAIAVAGGLAVIMIMIGGIEYITAETIGGKRDGKDKITNAIVGLLLAIGAYIILYTINPRALELNLGKITEQTPPATQGPTSPTTSAGTCLITSPCTKNTCFSMCAVGSTWPSDISERAELTGAGINITGTGGPTPCNKVGQDGCTSVYLLPSTAIQALIALKAACPDCGITVTGGTEFWSHQSHGPMIPRVDLNLEPTLDNYIKTKGSGPSMGNSCYNGQPSWQLNGHTFVLEDNNHWHICF